MDEIFLLDGVRYTLHRIESENELQQIIKEHYTELFGQDSIFFDFEPKLRSDAGIGSKPDGYALILSPKPRWVVIEAELADHPLYEHIIPQISKFVKALENPRNRKSVVEAIYDEVSRDPFKKALLVKRGLGHEIYKFLNDIISTKPRIAIVIDRRTTELDEVLSILPLEPEITELRTFEREGVGLSVHAHSLRVEAAERKEEKKEEEGFKERHIKRFEFWRQLLAKSKTRMDLFARRSPGKDHWISAGAGRSGLAYGYVALMDSVLIELYIDTVDKNKNKKIFDELFKKKQQIESDFGEALNWQRLDDKRACRISKMVEQKGLKSEHDWPALQDKMIDAMTRFDKALSKHIKTLT